MHIGSVVIESPAIQAALSGYSDWPMRMIARRCGAPYTLCEVFIDRFVNSLKQRKRTEHFLKVTDDEHPVGGQLMGAVPEDFGPAALRLVAAGFDVIDINFGCPVKKALGRCRGGYHLGQPQVALQIVDQVREVVPAEIPVTVKMRRALDDSAESRDQFFQILDGAFERGVSAITVHGRTVQQRYRGPSDWNALAAVKQHAGRRTIIGSGDLFSAADCVRMLNTTGVDGVSLARGAIGNPWLFAQTQALLAGQPLPPAPSLFEQRDVIRQHYSLSVETYGEAKASTAMRKFGIQYAASHPACVEVRNAFARVRSPEEWRSVLETWYAEDLPGAYPAGPTTHTAVDSDETDPDRPPDTESGFSPRGDHATGPAHRR